MNLQPKPPSDDSNCPPDWQASNKWTLEAVLQRIGGWGKDQAVLFEAFWVAVTFHILLFPFFWFIGWALPWPKSPSITTVIEINLTNWPREARPEKIEELYNYQLNKAHQSQ